MTGHRRRVSVLFSEPKISQLPYATFLPSCPPRFSALQRAENFSIEDEQSEQFVDRVFQCSSASRKFLNRNGDNRHSWGPPRFSALQRAENFSIRTQRASTAAQRPVSVLFSEPKISQSSVNAMASHFANSFSALQRAENFSMRQRLQSYRNRCWFQCSSASRKFLNSDPRTCIHPYSRPR